MAGIGFPLLKMYERNTLSSRMQVVGHAMFIAAGPSLMTILCFVLVALFTGGVATEAVVAFRIAVVYAFATAFVVAAPVSLVAARLVSDAFTRGDFTLVRSIYIVAVGLAAVAGAGCAAVVFAIASQGEAGFVISASALAALVSGLFVAASFATALREFRAVTFAFAAGAGLSCVLVTAAILLGEDETVIILAFHLGLIVAFFGISMPLFATFPDSPRTLSSHTGDMLTAFRRHRLLAFGGFCGALGVWADKIVLWWTGRATTNGLMHQPAYDSSIFIAYVLILPGLSVFLVLSESELFRGLKRYQSALDNRGTLRQIETELQDLGDRVTRLIFQFTLAQMFAALIMILAAPLAIELFRLDYGQLPVLRFLILAGVFQFAFLASSTVILFIGDVRGYVVAQVLFLSLNTTGTILVQTLAPEVTGLGYLIACAVAATAAYHMQLRSIGNLNADIMARA